MKRKPKNTTQRAHPAAKPPKTASTEFAGEGVEQTIAGELYILLDESGSMVGRRGVYMQALNKYLQDVAAVMPNILVTLVQFNSVGFEPRFALQYENRLPVNCPPRNYDNYQPNGGTPLYDCMAQLIARAEKGLNVPKQLCIVTDGEERDSKVIKSREMIAAQVEAKQAAGWAFVFLGKGLEAFGEASNMGISAGNAARYNDDTIYESISGDMLRATSRYMGSKGFDRFNLMNESK